MTSRAALTALCFYALGVTVASAQLMSSPPTQPGTGLALFGGVMNLRPAGPTTIGGVNSVVCATHTWLNTISTLGVPICAQPGFSDLAGQAALTQLPTIGANTALGSVAGGTPIALSSAQITAMINLATASLPGALPAWPGNASTYFNGAGSYASFGTNVAPALGNPLNASGGLVGYSGAFGDATGTSINLSGATLSSIMRSSVSGGAPVNTGTTDPNGVTNLGNSNVAFRFGIYANGDVWVQPSSVAGFGTNFNTVFNPNGGFVGVGVANPTSQLHVKGAIAQNGATSGTSVLVPPATGGGNIQLPAGAAVLASLNIPDQTLTGGANVTSQSLSSGNVTIDCGSRSTQFITGATSAWTITAPANDGSCFVLLTNAASSAVVPTFSGFTVGSNTGATLTTAASAKFTISVWRVNGIAAYSIFAHQ